MHVFQVTEVTLSHLKVRRKCRLFSLALTSNNTLNNHSTVSSSSAP